MTRVYLPSGGEPDLPLPAVTFAAGAGIASTVTPTVESLRSREARS